MRRVIIALLLLMCSCGGVVQDCAELPPWPEYAPVDSGER